MNIKINSLSLSQFFFWTLVARPLNMGSSQSAQWMRKSQMMRLLCWFMKNRLVIAATHQLRFIIMPLSFVFLILILPCWRICTKTLFLLQFSQWLIFFITIAIYHHLLRCRVIEGNLIASNAVEIKHTEYNWSKMLFSLGTFNLHLWVLTIKHTKWNLILLSKWSPTKS